VSWPIFYTDNLIVGNERSPLGICTLWSRKEEFSDFSRDSFSVIGNLYTNYGLNYLIRNILANPRIRYIIICGKDLTKTGDMLINFFKNGVDKNYKIIGANAYVDDNIPEDDIEVLRNNIKIIDLRNEKNAKDEIKEFLKEIPKDSEPFMDSLIIKEKERSIEKLTSDDVVFRIEGENIADVWLKILDIVLKFGEVKETEYKIKQKEVLDVVAVIKNDGDIPEWFPVSKENLEEYFKQFFVKDKPEGVDYSYGERLFGLELNLPQDVKEYLQPQILKEARIILNQIDLIVKKLKSAKFTRRAIAVTWRHEIDSTSENPPCLVEIVWSVKNNKLYQTCTFRSHDIFGAWLFNIFALRNLQKDIAEQVKVEVGNLVVLSVSAHIYENNWEKAENFVEKYYSRRPLEFEEDPRGFFIIKVENNEILVEHRLNDGRKTKYEFGGKLAEEVYRRILNENLVSKLDHASYLGKELARAEMALNEGKSFEQERA